MRKSQGTCVCTALPTGVWGGLRKIILNAHVVQTESTHHRGDCKVGELQGDCGVSCFFSPMGLELVDCFYTQPFSGWTHILKITFRAAMLWYLPCCSSLLLALVVFCCNCMSWASLEGAHCALHHRQCACSAAFLPAASAQLVWKCCLTRDVY